MAGAICGTAKTYFSHLGDLLKRIDPEPIEAFADLAYRAWADRRQVFIFGNGGSAATASHFVCDLVKTAAVDGRPRLAAIALNDNAGTLTALGNDITYDETFRYPLETYARPGDIAVAISCSGNSPNVLCACKWAKENRLTVVGLTGFEGGKLKGLVDLHINVPSDNFGLVEDIHLSVGHVAAQILKSRILALAATP